MLRVLLCMCAAHMICMLLVCSSAFPDCNADCVSDRRSWPGAWSCRVRREEPDVVHPAEMREDCEVHLQIVSSAANDITRFLSVPLFCQLREVMLHELVQQHWSVCVWCCVRVVCVLCACCVRVCACFVRVLRVACVVRVVCVVCV